MPLPPSPAVIVSQIDRQTAAARAQLRQMYARAGVVDAVERAREVLSTSGALETLAIAVELWGLRPELMPWKYAGTVPASSTLGTGELAIKAPDVFVLLSADWWSVFVLWLMTSVVLPMTCAYFFNLTHKSKSGGAGPGAHKGTRAAVAAQPALEYDPLTFNVAKGLVMYLLYAQNVRAFGWPSYASMERVERSVPGGYQGTLIASGIGALVSVYEAVLRK